MAERTVKLSAGSDIADLIDSLDASLDRAEIYRAIGKFFDRRGARIAGRIVKEKLSGQSLNRRTGALARSIVGEGGIINGVPTLRVGVLRGPSLAYAAALEFGTKGKNPTSPIPTIRPKNAKALAIPVNDALTAAGVARYPSPRDYPSELKVVPFENDGGNTVAGLFDKDEYEQAEAAGGNLESVKALWLLLKSVDLEPRWYLRDVFFEDIESVVVDLAEFLASLISGDEPGRLTA